MIKHRFYALAMGAVVLVAGSGQYSSGQTAAQGIDREDAAATGQIGSVDSSLLPAKTKTYKFRSVDVPGAYWTDVNDYNGKIAVGNYYDTMSSPRTAFFLKSNVYKVIKPASSATESWAWGVNKSGEIVGAYIDALDALHGFVSDGTNVSTFDYPGASGTAILGINDAGDMSGIFSEGGNYQGFLYNKSKNTFATINYPSATKTEAYSVNSSDVVAGYYEDSAGNPHGFLWNNGVYTVLDYPGASATLALGINDSGLIAGGYTAGGVGHGFLFDGQTYTTVDVPGGKGAYLWRVKNNKNVIGIVADLFGNYHGVIGH